MLNNEFARVFHTSHSDSGWGDASLNNRPLTARFFNRPASEVARDLLGKKIISSIGGKEVSGLIVETQAYTGAGDPETHLYKGKSSGSVKWKPGSLYIYSIMGQSMLTIATPPYAEGACVLIRALEPVDGLKVMGNRRGIGTADKLTSGPGNVSKALGISAELNGSNIFEGNGIQVVSGYKLEDQQIIKRPRLNCIKNPEPLLRFYVGDSRWVTRPK